MAGLIKMFLLGFLNFFIICSCSYYSNSLKATRASQANGITDTLTNNLNVSQRATIVHETYSLYALSVIHTCTSEHTNCLSILSPLCPWVKHLTSGCSRGFSGKLLWIKTSATTEIFYLFWTIKHTDPL